MSVFGSIMSAIFGKHAQAAPAGGASTPTTSGSTGSPSTGSAAPGGGGRTSASGSAGGGGAGSSVDVAAVLTQRASQKGEKLDWRHSIVDLMKVLDLDSSLSNRKALAQELHYSGDTNDSATMNTWLHRQVMQKLAENGGNVPQDLKH